MKIKSFCYSAFVVLLLFFGYTATYAQKTRLSPKATATGKIGDANVTIDYGSPSVKNRKIWGELVPYNKVWRSGANEATEIQTDKDLLIEGKLLKAGRYSLYTIPRVDNWQVIINSQTGQWGVTESGETTRNPEKDVLVVTVKPIKNTTQQEKLVYKIDNSGIKLEWENTVVPISVKKP